jgi:hypothetical protein
MRHKEDLTMSILTHILIAAALVTAAAGPAAAMDQFQSGGKKFKIHKVQLGIAPTGGAGCAPIPFKTTGWVYMTHPTTVEVMIVKEGQGVVGGPYSIKSVKAANGQYVATYSNNFVVNTPVHEKYRMIVGGGSGMGSNWVPLNVDC